MITLEEYVSASLQKKIEAYSDFLNSQNLSDRTCQNYMNYIRQSKFISFVKNEGQIDELFECVNIQLLKKLKTAFLSKSSIRKLTMVIPPRWRNI